MSSQAHILDWSFTIVLVSGFTCCKVPKFSHAQILPSNLPKIQTKRPNLSLFRQNDASGIAKSEDTGQTAPLGAV